MLVAECIGDLSPVFLAVAVELILPAAGIVEGLVDRADLRVRQGGPEIVENLLRDLRVGDEETLEVLQLEEGGEDYLGFNIGFERPEGSTPQKTEPAVILPSIPIVSVEQVSLEVTPQEYFKPDIRRFSIDDSAPFRLSVDVLNYGLREEYLGKHYGAWMKGAFEFTANNTAYMIWFPIADKKSDPSKVVTLEKVAPMLDELAAIIEGFNKLIRENNLPHENPIFRTITYLAHEN